jgi:hypothetical protein
LRKKGEGVLILLLLAGSASAQITKVKGGYLMRTKYTAGHVVRYQTVTTSGNVGSSANGISVKIPLTLTVLSVVKEVAKVRMDIGAGLLNGKAFSPAHSTTVSLDALDSTKAQGAKLPPHPIQPGATWTAMRPVQLGPGGSALELDGVYHFQGIKVVDGNEVAVIVYDMKGAANGSGTMLLLTSDGSIYSNTMQIGVRAIDPTATIKIVMTRLPEKSGVHKPRK